MKQISIILTIGLLLISNIYATPIKVSSNIGMKLMSIAIQNGSAKTYVKDAEKFAPQKNLLYCAPASVAIVLNSIGIKRPFNATYAPDYSLFDQNNVFNQKLAKEGITPTSVMTAPGMDLKDVTKMLNSFDEIKAYSHNTTKETVSSLKKNILEALKSGNSVIAQIQRTCIGENGGGHFSPITSYAEYNDKTYFLFMDVSSYKDFGHVWVSSSELYKGMSDKCDGYNGRGYIIIKKTS
jgi:hypothetical protein